MVFMQPSISVVFLALVLMYLVADLGADFFFLVGGREGDMFQKLFHKL